MNKIKIMAHRGVSFHAPENTRAAFLKAYEFDVDGIETDLQLTGDGEIVIHHNYFIDNTSDGWGAIPLLSLRQLKTYDFGLYKGSEFAGEKILTLRELLPVVENMSIINLELKSHPDKSVDFAGKTLEIVEESGLGDKVIFSSFDPKLLGELKHRKPGCRVGLLTFQEKMQIFEREMTAAFTAAYPGLDYRNILEHAGNIRGLTELVDSLDYKPDFLHPDFHSVLEKPELVMEMHRRGIGVNPYTCDTEDEMIKLAALGCDGIITNRPDIACRLFRA